jgi:P27 family predicted phage terminase small subunit
LDDDARDAWHRISHQLDELGLLTSADAEAVALYCSAFSRWIKANEAIAEEGLTVSSQFGDKVNPHVGIAEAAAKQMVRLLTQFGMTPASRSSLRVGAKTEEDPLIAFLALKSSHAQAQGQPKPKAKPKAQAKAKA